MWTFIFYVTQFKAGPPCWEYISQLVQYSSLCISYRDFADRGLLLRKNVDLFPDLYKHELHYNCQESAYLLEHIRSPFCGVCVSQALVFYILRFVYYCIFICLFSHGFFNGIFNFEFECLFDIFHFSVYYDKRIDNFITFFKSDP